MRAYVSQMMPLGSHNSSFATKRGVQTPVKSNPMEAVELNDLVNLEVSDGTDEGTRPSFPRTSLSPAVCTQTIQSSDPTLGNPSRCAACLGP